MPDNYSRDADGYRIATDSEAFTAPDEFLEPAEAPVDEPAVAEPAETSQEA